MEIYKVSGNTPLSGSVKIQGAKNSVLPILAATVLCRGESIIRNVPKLSDVDNAVRILRALGCSVVFEGGTISVSAANITSHVVPDALMGKMRSSVIFLGAIAGRCGRAELSNPGGCRIGARPVDLHLAALRTLGAEITECEERIICQCESLRGNLICFPTVSVGATENAMLAAATAKGITIIRNAACEPEIYDLQSFLNKAGARISGAGTSMITVEGVQTLHAAEYTVMPDRIAAATYMACVLCAGGAAEIIGTEMAHLAAFASVMEKAGAEFVHKTGSITIKAPYKTKAVGKVVTAPYPGFATDAQSLLMAAMLKSDGVSMIEENIFENRFKSASQFCKMGACITLCGKTARITGVRALYGTDVEASDLRGGAALVCACLGAYGETRISGVEYIDRGYENFEQNLTALGCNIVRITE